MASQHGREPLRKLSPFGHVTGVRDIVFLQELRRTCTAQFQEMKPQSGLYKAAVGAALELDWAAFVTLTLKGLSLSLFVLSLLSFSLPSTHSPQTRSRAGFPRQLPAARWPHPVRERKGKARLTTPDLDPLG